jgi:hypothetical protein
MKKDMVGITPSSIPAFILQTNFFIRVVRIAASQVRLFAMSLLLRQYPNVIVMIVLKNAETTGLAYKNRCAKNTLISSPSIK